MSDADRFEFQAVYRHPEKSLVAFPIAIALFGYGIYYLVSNPAGDFAKPLTFIAVVPLAVIVLTALAAIRGYTWALKDDGLHIHEWPRFVLFGLSRRRIVPYARIKALRRTETALGEVGVDLVTTDGQTFHMPDGFDRWGKIPRRRKIPEECREPILDHFLQTIRAMATAHGNPDVFVAEGLDFWSRGTGLALQVLLLLMTLAPAALVILMLLDGEPFSGTTTGKGSATYGAGIALLLPFGALWMLRRSLKRRSVVKEAAHM